MDRTFAFVLTAIVATLGTGCSSTTVFSDDELLPPLTGEAATYAEVGSGEYDFVAGEFPGVYGCTVNYETWRPQSGSGDSMVFLAHGFMRSLKSMRGWAEHWASHGVATTVMSLCNSNLIAGRHDRNAEDMVALAAELHDGPVIYSGFSAGGLAAMLAAAADTRTAAYLGLDSVDSKTLAASAAAPAYPATFLIAEPAACNARNSILEATAGQAGNSVLRVTGGTHCLFEYPYDSKCEIACGKVKPETAQSWLQGAIRSFATSWVLEQASDNPTTDEERILNTIGGARWDAFFERLQ